MKQILQIHFVVLLLVSLASASVADNFEVGLQAYLSGDLQKAYQVWLIEAERGTPTAQNNLGFMLENGQGVEKDYKAAAKWYRMAAENGNAVAQNNLGTLYANGQGVAQNSNEAVKWYRMAAEQGYADAHVNLGIMYFEGRGVSKSYEDAYACWVVAAEKGIEIARENMEIGQRKMTANQIKRGQQIAKQVLARPRN